MPCYARLMTGTGVDLFTVDPSPSWPGKWNVPFSITRPARGPAQEDR